MLLFDLSICLLHTSSSHLTQYKMDKAPHLRNNVKTAQSLRLISSLKNMFHRIHSQSFIYELKDSVA